MAKFSRSNESNLKKAYDKYFQKMRKDKKQPMTYYHWKRSGRRAGIGGVRGTTDKQAYLRRSERKRVGLSD